MRIFIVFQILGRFVRWLLPGAVNMTDAEKVYDTGVRMQRQGRLDDAVKRYTQAIHMDHSLAQAYSNRGSTYLSLGQPENALADLDEAIRLNPTLAVAYSNRGLAYTNLAKFREAVNDLNEAVRLNPNFADAYSSRGFAHRAAGRLFSCLSRLANLSLSYLQVG